MTDFNKLADALENIAHMEYPSGHHDGNNLREAARILRSAAGVDVDGLMALARILAGAAYASAVDDINGAGADATKEAAAETALESALRMALAAREWQPIETAPKDGTEIILFGPYPANEQGLPTDRVTAGFWLVPDPPVIGYCGGECRCPEYGEPKDPHWCTIHGGSDSGWMSTDGGFTVDWPPTHWMPLPAAAPKGTP